MIAPAIAAVSQSRMARCAHEERPAQVHREHPVEVGDSELVRVAGDLDPGVVDQDVDAAVLLHHLVEHRVDLPGVGHVGGDQDRLRARRRQLPHAQVHPVLDRVPRLLGALRAADVVDGDVDALLAQPDRDRLPDARAAPGDQRLLALQTLHGFSPRPERVLSIDAAAEQGGDPQVVVTLVWLSGPGKYRRRYGRGRAVQDGQRGGREQQHGGEPGGDQCRTGGRREHAELLPDRHGRDDERQRRRLQQARGDRVAGAQSLPVQHGRSALGRARAPAGTAAPATIAAAEANRHRRRTARRSPRRRPARRSRTRSHRASPRSTDGSSRHRCRPAAAPPRPGTRRGSPRSPAPGPGRRTRPAARTANRTRICAVVSCSWRRACIAGHRPAARINASVTSTATRASPPRSSNIGPIPADSAEKNSDSRITAPKSAIDAAATTSWPASPSIASASLRTGTTSPSDVAHSVIATSSGAVVSPVAAMATPRPIAIANDSAKPASARRSGRPLNRWTSISRPARNSRKARPMRARTCTGGSIVTHPSTEGPSTMPATISSTGDGTRTTGIARTTSGATTATADTTSRLRNDM